MPPPEAAPGARWRTWRGVVTVLETVRIDLPAEQKVGLVWMRDEVSYEQDYQPSQFFRRQIIRMPRHQ